MLKFLKKKKNSVISKGIKKFITAYLERKKLGELSSFKLDSKKRNIYLTLLLQREKEPLEIIVSNYSFVQEGEKGYFTFDSITTSRDWNSRAFERLVANEDKKIKVPDKYIKIITMFL
jgi:hypothetical protein